MFDVSIIIPVYKAKYTIKKTLESINNQKFKNKIPKIYYSDIKWRNQFEIENPEIY